MLNSSDPEMQLAWAADALVYVGVCADNEERLAAARPNTARSATPRIEHQLKQDAMNIVTFLADQHHPKAEFLRGIWLEWGRFGQREDKKEAFRCYSRAADRGYARAEYRIGMLYESYNDPIKALRHYHRGVEAGDAASCYRLGMMTLRGQHGQPQDFPRALDLIKKSAHAADENAAQGAYVYGMLLARLLPQIEIPDGVLAFDERAARINIEKAAYLKFAKAQVKMGSSYELGSLGCEFSPALSIHYNALASKQGEAEADMALSKWFLVGHETLFPKNEELAYTYGERAAASGMATAQFALGYFNEIGMYVPVDLEKAMEWYQKAAQNKNEDAKGRIEGLQRKQVLSKKDHENVAISRIKSQYGSQRGQRPERLQQQNRKSGLSQSVTPDQPSNGTPAPPQKAGSGFQPPPRGSSTTPYPLDDRPPTVAPIERPPTVTPYPMEDGPPQQKLGPRLGPTGGFFNAQPPPRPATTVNPDRPSSAFQLNPEIRSNSSMSVPQAQPYGPHRSAPPGQYPPTGSAPGPRPATSQPVHDPRARLGAGQRIVSGPAGMQQYGSPLQPQGGFAPHPTQGLPPQRPGMLPHQPTAPAAVPQTQVLPKMDIGFSAPYDERRNRTYGPGRIGLEGKAQSPVLQSSNSVPNFDQAQQGRISAPNSRPGSRAPDLDRRRYSGGGGGGGGVGGPRPLQKDGLSGQAPAPSSTPRPNAPTSSGAQAKPKPAVQAPGKGPKTFEEMGVPAHKQDTDCVSQS